jgi:hypothetical protein
MNKLAFTLATVAALSLGTVAFAQTSATPSSPKAVQSTQSKAHVTKQVKKRHHAATNKTSRHSGSNSKKVVTKHAPATKTMKTKAAS